MASGARCGRACEGYERPGVAFGRGDDRSSSVWCVHALYAAPSLPHPRAREARFRHVPSYRSRARPEKPPTVYRSASRRSARAFVVRLM